MATDVTGATQTAGTAAGTAIAGPVGGAVGGTIGKFIGSIIGSKAKSASEPRTAWASLYPYLGATDQDVDWSVLRSRVYEGASFAPSVQGYTSAENFLLAQWDHGVYTDAQKDTVISGLKALAAADNALMAQKKGVSQTTTTTSNAQGAVTGSTTVIASGVNPTKPSDFLWLAGAVAAFMFL